MASPIYAVKGNSQSDQAESSTENPNAGTWQSRMLVELQLLNFLLAEALGHKGDLQETRQSIADSIT